MTGNWTEMLDAARKQQAEALKQEMDEMEAAYKDELSRTDRNYSELAAAEEEDHQIRLSAAKQAVKDEELRHERAMQALNKSKETAMSDVGHARNERLRQIKARHGDVNEVTDSSEPAEVAGNSKTKSVSSLLRDSSQG